MLPTCTGVMPPDEHAQSINNSVYTNVGAKLSVHFARYAACLAGMNATEEVPDDWLEVADKLYLPFNSEGQYHPEFEGFEEWTGQFTLLFIFFAIMITFLLIIAG